MEVLFNAIQTTLASFDFAFCIIVNVLTYLIIRILNDRNGNKNLTTWSKRKIMLLIVILLGVIYWLTGSDIKLIINSAILAPVFWSWVMKPLCKKLKIDYKQINIFK